jgi:hypothetical protein
MRLLNFITLDAVLTKIKLQNGGISSSEMAMDNFGHRQKFRWLGGKNQKA